MAKLFIFILISLISNLKNFNALTEERKIKANLVATNDLIWEYSDEHPENSLDWDQSSEYEVLERQIRKFKYVKNNNLLSVRSTGKGVSVNGYLYPDISNYVPNAYVEDPNKLFGLNSRVISKTRHCEGNNFSEKCIDGIVELDFKLFNNDNISIYPKINFQSLTNRGTEIGEGINLGVKIAKEFSPNFSVAFGGENIVHFDETIDLGRNFYLVASKYFPLNYSEKSPILFLNAGIGSDFYGYKGNGFLFRTTCFGTNTLTGTADRQNSCTWGPIGSVALSLNDRISIISEWFGYSYGTGFSVRPFENDNLSISLFATDYINGFPKYADQLCHENSCTTRFYGSISLNF